ncbi:hypothetical protein Focb16_v015257 [Fusarium oxysporum f. sp. cubense]|uniref:Uncharacterized protein n=1 Tax=Fusarium oxysporum f. sp. cubense TaxID=61366 RepID=A0A559KV19_FUSOC|nr:hypothetical protein Focb16_v015257 [Fusarium oxysporum f. sp. cubense]
MSSNANTRPAPPYTGAPPSTAKLMAEVQQLYNTIRNLQTQVNKQQSAAPANNNTGEPRGCNLGEALKLPKPEPFKGQAADIIPFLTRMKGYFHLFLNKLDTATKKLLFTAPLI